MSYKFPEGFWWGSATSGPQSEGSTEKANKSIWDHWYEIESYKFHNEIGLEEASDFYRTYKTDISLMKEIGQNTFRTSIQWSRLIKDFNTGEVDEKAVEFYNNVIDELIKNDVDPFMNLYHFDMPMPLQEIGGWENREVVDRYVEFATKAFELFGDRVKKWFTFNEPIVHVECGYLYSYHYPMEVDFKKAVQVGFHTQLASSRAIESYRKLNLDGEIGIILNLTPSYPRSKNPYDVEAAEKCDLFFNKSYLDPAVHGEFPKGLCDILKKHGMMPIYKKEDLEIIKNNTVDILGVNYYQPRRVKAKVNTPNPNSPFMPGWYFDRFDMPGKRMNPHRGWEIYYEGLYDIAINLKDNYKNIKWYVAENGMGVEGEEKFIKNGMVEDDYRIKFIKGHLISLHRAMEEGSNCHGYHLWTFIDCWSWLNAYKNRYGFISLNLETKKREIKKSGHWLKSVTEKNEI